MENYIVSARKYRPSTFASVVGQHALTTTLKNAIKSNHLAHAYLFCGPRGVGKTTCARIFAKTINCSNLTADLEACNACESCCSFNEQRSYNIHELDGASNNSVDEIRSLIEQVRIPPQIGKYSVYIVDEVHMLSSNAFNAFLKTLEEPPAHAIFILATTEKHKILPTILSRCQIYDFSRITIKDTIEHLKYVAKQENISVTEEALNVVAQKSDGGMRDALSIFDQLVSFCNSNITYENAIETLNVLDYEYYFKLVENFLKGDVGNTLLIFNEILNKGFDAQHFVTGLSSHLRDVLVSKNPETSVLLETSQEIAKRYQEQAAQCHPTFIFEALNIANECDINYRTAKNKRLLVELMLIRLSQIMMEGEKKKHSREIASIAKPASTLPTSTTQVTTAQTTATPQATVVGIRPAAPKTTPISVPVANFQRISITTNFNQVQKTATDNNTQDKTEKIILNKEFTETDLQEAWESFIGKVAQNGRLVSIIQMQQPQLIADNTFQVMVSNASQEAELLRIKPELLTHIHQLLQNNLVKMQISISTKLTSKRAFTAEEKYKLLSEKNPALITLKEKFDLQIE